MGQKTRADIQPSALARRNRALLLELARKYIWWLTPEQALAYPARVVAQVMNIGVFDDMMRMAAVLGGDCLRVVIRDAEAGQFNARSWHYWHYRLGLAEPDRVPPLPIRRLLRRIEIDGL